MATNTDTSTVESIDATTRAESDLCDFLAERSELSVSFEEPDDNRARRYDRLPVARTQAGTQADVSDFPSGKSDSQGNFSKKTFTRYRDTVNDFLQSQDVSDLDEVTPRGITQWLRVLQERGYARTTRDTKLETLGVFIKWAESQWLIDYVSHREKLSEIVSQKRDDLDVSGDEKSRAGDDDYESRLKGQKKSSVTWRNTITRVAKWSNFCLSTALEYGNLAYYPSIVAM